LRSQNSYRTLVEGPLDAVIRDDWASWSMAASVQTSNRIMLGGAGLTDVKHFMKSALEIRCSALGPASAHGRLPEVATV
jgi:hypothetical protein